MQFLLPVCSTPDFHFFQLVEGEALSRLQLSDGLADLMTFTFVNTCCGTGTLSSIKNSAMMTSLVNYVLSVAFAI